MSYSYSTHVANKLNTNQIDRMGVNIGTTWKGKEEGWDKSTNKIREMPGMSRECRKVGVLLKFYQVLLQERDV